METSRSAPSTVWGRYSLLRRENCRVGTDARDVIQVEIGEEIFEIGNDLEVSGGIRQVERVAAMAGSFGDANTGGAHGAEGFESGMHQQRMRVDAALGFELHQVGLEHHAAAAHVEPVLAPECRRTVS